MKFFRIQAKLLAALMVQEDRQSNAPQGLTYLPGSTLRGAIAAHYLRKGGAPDDTAFSELFLEKPVCFPDLFPADSADQLSIPLPLTACSCKRYPGFLRENGHGVADALAAHVAAQLEQRPLVEAFVCRTCQQDMRPIQGFWNGTTERPQRFDPVIVYQRHTGIDRHTGTVAPSIFYITQGISDTRKGEDLGDQTQYLTGGVYLRQNQFEILCSCLSETIFAGADRTRGMGEMELTLKECASPDFDLGGWDGAFRKKVAELTSKPLPSGLYFSLGLLGNAILVDRFLRPSPEIVLNHDSIISAGRIIRQHIVRGWQSTRQLPKTEDTAIAMGSVYLFQYRGGDISGLAAYLQQLEVEGIGLRRTEGFGRISVCDPIHVREVI
jgi:CRISPR-associated Csx10 family RAMP protein